MTGDNYEIDRQFDRALGKIRSNLKEPYTPVQARHADEWNRCRSDVVYWIEKYCLTFDPRREDGDRWVPFVLWPRQKEYMEWLALMYKGKRHCVVLKCRDVGASWLTLCFFTHIWLFEESAKLSLGSRKEEYVDSSEQIDALFPKIRSVLYHLPEWMRPPGFSRREHDLRMKLSNPANGSMITGEAGKNMGTGGRSTAYLCDEFARVECQSEVQASIQDNSDFIVYVSTPRGMNNEFARMVLGGEHPVFKFSFKDDPRRNFYQVLSPDGKVTSEGNGHCDSPGAVWPWYESQKLTRNRVNLASQVDASLTGSVEFPVFQQEWIQACTSAKFKAQGEVLSGLDLGDSDESANTVLTVRQGPVGYPQYKVPGKAVSQKMRWLMAQCSTTRVDGKKISQVVYDAAGPSGSAFSNEIEDKEFPFVLFPFIGQGPPSVRLWPDYTSSQEKFANRRAEAYFIVSERMRRTFERQSGVKHHPQSECMSFPHDDKLVAQLMSIEFETTETGKLKVMSKAKMREKGIHSPNEADSLVYAFAFDKINVSVARRFGD